MMKSEASSKCAEIIAKIYTGPHEDDLEFVGRRSFPLSDGTTIKIEIQACGGNKGITGIPLESFNYMLDHASSQTLDKLQKVFVEAMQVLELE